MMRLDYKRFGTSIKSSGAWETRADDGRNESYVYATFTQKADSNTWNTSGSAYYNISCDGKSTGNVSFTFTKGSEKTFEATLGPYYHNADGSLGNKEVVIYVNGDVNNGTHTVKLQVSFTKFARGFSSIPSLSLQSKTNTSFTLNWGTSESASEVWWDLYNSAGTLLRSSSSSVGSGTGGSFQITGLSGNTTYKVRIRAKRADSSLWDNGTSNTNTYATYITQTLGISFTNRTETTLTVKATPNVAIASKSWTVKAGSTTVKTSTSTNESVQFTGLSANTNYTVYVSYVSTSANGGTTTSGNASQSTFQYPYVSAVGTAALPIGNSQTLTLYNPLSRSVTVYMKKDNTSGTQFYSGTTTGTSIIFTPTASTMYSSIPSATSGNCVYYCIYSNQNVGTKSGTYVTKGTETPTFSASNWSYTANLTELTNNNQVVIPNYSTVTFRLDTVATGSNSATISSYNVNWGGEVSLGGTTAGTTKAVTGKTGSSLSMIAVDSRNYRTSTAKELQSGTTYIPYTVPTVTSINTHRTDGIQAETSLGINGKFYATNFGGATGSHTNTLFSANYYVKASSSSTWSSAYPIATSNFTINTTNGTYSLSNFKIHANGTSGGFPVGTRYDIKVEIKDAKGLLGTLTATSSVTDGKIARDVYQDSNGEYHEGINGRADNNYNQKIHGTLNVTGNTTLNGTVTLGSTGSHNISADGSTYSGTSAVANKLGTSTVGNSREPIYLNSGTATKCDKPTSGNWFRGIPNVGGDGVMEVGRFIDFHPTNASTSDYSKRIDAGTGTTARNITIPDESGTIQLKPTNLYNNSSGTTGTVTLSQSAANFNMIEIFFMNVDTCHCSVKIYQPNNQIASLLSSVAFTGGTGISALSAVHIRDVVINGTSISTHSNTNNGTYYGSLVIWEGQPATLEKTNYIYITRVDGYK